MAEVIELGEFRVTTLQRRRVDGCKHLHFTVDTQGDIVTCDDCGKQISGVYGLSLLVESYNREMNRLQRRLAEQKTVEQHTVHLKAARAVDRAWKGKMVPACPHCGSGILATDGLGSTLLNKEMVLRRRAVAGAGKEMTDHATPA
jgi:hypothetical protein